MFATEQQQGVKAIAPRIIAAIELQIVKAIALILSSQESDRLDK
ncbi:hypothetical protein [Aliterella atlantica]|nr:hypothetical protein [Aliterella atlantica]